MLCTACGGFGHLTCLRIEYFQGYPFCGDCFPAVILEYTHQADAQRREQWTRALAEQVAGWRRKATEMLGVSASIGVTIGGAAASASAAAAALMQGGVEGARSATSNRSTPRVFDAVNVSINDVPFPDQCVACHTPNLAERRHSRTGDCIFFQDIRITKVWPLKGLW